MSDSLSEHRVILAINAIRSIPRISIRRAAQLYDIPATTIRRRMKGHPAKSDSRNAHLNLTEIEEEVIVQYVLDRDSRGFSPRIADVGDMANLLLRERGAPPVGKN